MTLVTGDLVGGRYCLEQVIGSGGMGDVWRARDRVLNRLVAIKLVYIGDPRRRAELTRNFLREARISAAIAHRNVVQIMDFGAHDGAVPFMVMELLEGETLAHVLGRGDPVSLEWILAVMCQALEGLSAAHDAGVIHRDLKPENIFLVHESQGVYPKILDFGISKVLEAGETDTAPTTLGGRLLGTPAYMSPEQARGLRNIDKRSDVYSMGVVMYELLSGTMPFFAENPGDLLMMIVNEPTPEVISVAPDVGRPLSDLVARAMRNAPWDRHADARELRAGLIEVAGTILGSEGARRLGSRVRPGSWRRAHADLPTEAATPQPDRTAKLLRGDASTEEVASIVGPTTKPHNKRQVWWVALAGAVVLGLGLTAIFFGRSNAAPAPRFIVVSADDRAARDTKLSGPADLGASAEPTAPAASAKQKVPDPRVLAEVPSSAASAARDLARSFRSQKGGVVQCVNEHAEEISRTPVLAVRLALDADGHVRKAEVAPSSLSTLPVGRCIEAAVRSMRFAAQGSPISFQVPLTTKRGG